MKTIFINKVDSVKNGQVVKVLDVYEDKCLVLFPDGSQAWVYKSELLFVK